MHINKEMDPALQLEESELFEQETRRHWRLSSLWDVTDVGIIETHSRVIQEAKHHRNNKVSDKVKAACEALIAAYPGDFLEQMLNTYPEEFQPSKTSRVREPFTLYRESYLDAL